jgi:hypothetical protein
MVERSRGAYDDARIRLPLASRRKSLPALKDDDWVRAAGTQTLTRKSRSRTHIRFLQAGGEPLKIKFFEDAWRSRVRTILKGASKQN